MVRSKDETLRSSMVAPVEFRFEIKAYSPASMPMGRLARYLDKLSRILGESRSVHLLRIEEGSTVPVLAVEWEALPKIKKRANDIRNNEGPEDAQKARRAIENDLAEDNAKYGDLVDPYGSRILRFSGSTRSVELEYGPFSQRGTLDGVPIVVGGENDPVPVHLEDVGGRVYNCLASRELAKKIGMNLFTTPLRVSGEGRWFRDRSGAWKMRWFTIESFTKLRADSLADATERLRAIDAKWKDLPDPVGTLVAFRENEA